MAYRKIPSTRLQISNPLPEKHEDFAWESLPGKKIFLSVSVCVCLPAP